MGFWNSKMILVRGTDDGFKKNVISHLKKLVSLNVNQAKLFYTWQNFFCFVSVRSGKHEPEKNHSRDMCGLCYSITINETQSNFCTQRWGWAMSAYMLSIWKFESKWIYTILCICTPSPIQSMTETNKQTNIHNDVHLHTKIAHSISFI